MPEPAPRTERSLTAGWAVVLLLVACFTQFLYLASPRQVVFDEVHFGKFISAYCCTGERFFDIHPPHAKLLIAGAAAVGGYDGTFAFESIGQPYDEAVPVWWLRALPALTGALLPLIVFGILRIIGVGASFAGLSGMAVALDNAFTLQSRIIALDGILLAATFGALLCFLLAEKRAGTFRWRWYLIAGGLAGLAAGVKFTGLAILLLFGIVLGWRLAAVLWAKRSGRGVVLAGSILLAGAFVVYAAGWWAHWALLPQPGAGDAWFVPSGNMVADTITMHRHMLSANYNLAAAHPDASPWWHWPFMLTSVFYWDGPGTSSLYLLGNPVVWWGTTGLLIAALVALLADTVRRPWSERSLQVRWILLVGYAVALLPLARVPRVLFMYHYFTPLLFAGLLGVVWAEQALRGHKDWYHRGVVVCLIAIAAAFLFFSPVTYGFPISAVWQQALFWLPGWR